MNPYPLKKTGEASYQFTTSAGVKYTTYFISYAFLFHGYPEFSDNVYSFNLEVSNGNVYEQAMDERIAETVISVFREFFQSKKNVIIYICDTSDERHFTRKRKFDLWFWKYNDGTILKEDDIAMVANTQIYNSLLVLKENILLESIVSAFHSLNERLNDADLDSFKDAQE